MKVQTKVAGNDTVAHGVLTLRGDQSEATVLIEDIQYVFTFNVFPGPPTVTYSNPDSKTLLAAFAGAADVISGFMVPDAGTISGRGITLSFSVYTLRSNSQVPPLIVLTYTFLSFARVPTLLTVPTRP